MTAERRYMSEDERAAFVAAAFDADLPIRTLCLMVAFTGCRISEALELTWGQIDPVLKRVSLRSLQQRRAAEYRFMQLPNVLLDALDRMKTQTHASAEQPIWPCKRVTAWRQMKQVLIQANVSGVQASPQGLRNGFAFAALECGIPDAVVHRWLGNAYKGYMHPKFDPSPAQEREWIERVWRTTPIGRTRPEAPAPIERRRAAARASEA